MLAITILLAILSSGPLYANYITPSQQGPVDVMNTMVDFMSDTLRGVTFIAGLVFVAIAFYEYLRHRENPLEVPISKPITFLILGVILMLVQYIPMSEV